MLSFTAPNLFDLCRRTPQRSRHTKRIQRLTIERRLVRRTRRHYYLAREADDWELETEVSCKEGVVIDTAIAGLQLLRQLHQLLG